MATGACIAASSLAALLLGADPALAATRHVATNGSNSSAGSAERPWRSLGSSLSRLRAGDTLVVHGGTYAENVDPKIRPGSAAAPIRVQAAAGERPVVQGLLWLRRPSHWILDGINVTWRPGNRRSDHMVKMTNGRGWTIRNAELWNANSYAALLVAGTKRGEPSGWTVRDSCIHDTRPANGRNEDHLVYANTGPTAGPGLLTRNVLFNAANGHAVKLGGQSSGSGGARGVRVTHNTMYNTRYMSLAAWGATGNVFERNVMVRPIEGAILRSYRLRGRNVARQNLWAQARRYDLSDGGYSRIANGGGNIEREPRFDSVGSCSVFRPQEPVAAGYGRYAP
jgi:hypothetical protein